MKRLILALPALFVIAGFCAAQTEQVNFNQTGIATQEMTDGEGLAAPPPPAEPVQTPETVVVTQETDAPDSLAPVVNLTVHNYINIPEPAPVESPDSGGAAAEPVKAPPEYAASPPQYALAPAKAPFFFSPPLNDVQIVPALPNPYDGKTYRLQVGAYSDIGSASSAFQQLRAGGFDAIQEQEAGMFRVSAVGIPASRVYHATQRLGALGFNMVWVRE